MVLDTLKQSHKQFREISPYYIAAKPYKNISELFFNIPIKDISFADISKLFEQVSYKRNINPYYWNITSVQKRFNIFPTKWATIYKIEELEKIAKSAADIRISYDDKNAVESFLGIEGKKVLNKILILIQNIVEKFKWPLREIEIQYTCDIEVKNWNYILLLLIFESDFDKADEYLNMLYGELDMFSKTLTSEEQEIMEKLVYFDVTTTDIVSSA